MTGQHTSNTRRNAVMLPQHGQVQTSEHLKHPVVSDKPTNHCMVECMKFRPYSKMFTDKCVASGEKAWCGHHYSKSFHKQWPRLWESIFLTWSWTCCLKANSSFMLCSRFSRSTRATVSSSSWRLSSASCFSRASNSLRSFCSKKANIEIWTQCLLLNEHKNGYFSTGTTMLCSQ